ncbi:acyl-CoA carboxylase subunit epsilon [Streptomyces cavernicola]|uniref:Acyl-CoA carboxylase subunit epsilon n=1 Tax=Streptomyces cavernicola TaxID=3043613 RepID=A0ABT6SCD1_9ACTN|nr:acyl-CoA carboxylase subunit epsilon [Streptomyces sp. B-S-A6]MDI3405850.1 acyl-CoA carboxylase subunit epsilon [Streptomyces sp. B-S-A6]
MDGLKRKDALLRIERGHATEEELAAIAVTLLSLAAARSEPDGEESGGQCTVRWSRRERTRSYQAPHSWR